MRTSIVLGLGYGDEGKGVATSWLASGPHSLVVRFCGGHQAGHTVINKGYRHTFSNFGSGTLNGAHTYWSKYCTFYPPAFHKESIALILAGCEPVFFIDPMAMVATPFDVELNKLQAKKNQHGTVGVGFGTTVERNEETPYKLYVVDLFNEHLLRHKLMGIAKHYFCYSSEAIAKANEDIERFIDYVKAIRPYITLCQLDDIAHKYRDIVFEGAQGIMLDRDFGYFPHVTRAHTTSRNAMAMITKAMTVPTIYYALRSYATRHGAGPFPGENMGISFEDETNVEDKYQGKLRFGYHSSEGLQYALKVDSIYSGTEHKNLIISHLDQTEDQVLIDGGKFSPAYLQHLGFDNIYLNTTPSADSIIKAGFYKDSLTAIP